MSNERVKTIKERKVEEKITVRMTDTYLFDFTLYHTYSKLAGFLTNILGAAIAFMGIIMLAMGKIKPVQIIFYLVAAVVTNSLLVGNELAAVRHVELYMIGGYVSVICPVKDVYKIITDSQISKEYIRKAEHEQIPLVIAGNREQ
mgnify:CR=1 FL=1